MKVKEVNFSFLMYNAYECVCAVVVLHVEVFVSIFLMTIYHHPRASSEQDFHLVTQDHKA
jgi:hypothetical protein